ncbi:IS110-like element ISAar41 family transposase (plasmid) [Streptomyces sp. L7]|uniref:IS110 family transposase n=1 Tax=Streptomyces sp. L7 TaxID=3423954 RepID=UPI00389A5D9D
MPLVAEQYSHVIGADTHARTHSYAVIETVTGRLTAQSTFPASVAGIRRALAWIDRTAPGEVLAAVEGTGSYGANLHAALREAGIPVIEARPPKRTDRLRGKSDAIDAEAAARSVLGRQTHLLATPREGKTRSALRVLLAARRGMDSQRTADRNALTALLRSVDLGVDARRPLSDRRVQEITAWRVHPTDDLEQDIARTEAIRLARSVITLTGQLRENLENLRRHSMALAPGLLDKPGVGPFTAAVFLTAWSHPGRVRSEAAFATLAGAAPIPASSGNTIRHRLDRHGDRQLNRALDVVARSRLATDPETKAYAAKRQAEGNSMREIRRLLRRYIARQIFRELKASHTPTT